MAGRQDVSPEAAMVREIAAVLREESQYEIAARRGDEITQRYLTDAEDHERLDLERTAARMALIVATDRDAPFDALSERFRATCALAFRDVCSELAVLTDFGFACSELGKCEAGLQAVAEARERLATTDEKLPSAAVSDLSRLIELCHQHLCRDDWG